MRNLAPVLFTLGLLAGCGSDAAPTISVSASSTTLTSGDTTTLTIDVTDFELREPPDSHNHALTVAQHDHDHDHDHEGDTLSADGGHYHVYLDTTERNPLVMAWTPTVDVTVTTTVAGSHRLIVRLNADDHRFLKPEVKAHVDITVQ